MTLAETLLRQLENPSLTYDERVLLRCKIAADFEHRGQYEAAQDALVGLWRGVGQRPTLEGLQKLTAAEVLLSVGALSSSLATIQQDNESQERAKDLISESIRWFEELNEFTRADIARSYLAVCYWRQGANDSARVYLTDALQGLGNIDPEQKAKILVRLTLVEISSGRYHDALRTLTENASTFKESGNKALKGRFHGQLALVLRRLGTAERRQDYIDHAIVEYSEAIYNFEQAGHTSYLARDENNLGFLFSTIGRFDDAHKHIDRARRLFIDLKDSGGVARVDETRARVLLAEGRVREAERAVGSAVRVLEKGGENGTLAEALTTQGLVWARLGKVEESRARLWRAAEVGEQAGSLEEAGKALLTLLEEHAGWMEGRELFEVYRRADELLRKTQDAEIVGRLRRCAGRVMEVLAAELLTASGEGGEGEGTGERVSFYKAVRAYEARLIERALREGQGSVTRAARLLGFKHHGSLLALLRSRHKGLKGLRTPPTPRKRSLRREAGKGAGGGGRERQPVSILFAEGEKAVAEAVKGSMESLGWQVEVCGSGAEAWRRLRGQERYDLLIFDHELARVSGVELVRRARQLPHRRRTPVIVLSASDAEKEAWRAGADAVLKKPEDVAWLSATAGRLLPGGTEEK